MAYHNEVRSGDAFTPTASMHNDTARLLNSINGFSSKTGKGNKPSATVLKVYNPTDVDFAPGTPVNFDNDQAIVEEHVPIKSYSDEQAPWGVLKDGLQVGCFGSCIVSGPVTIKLSGNGKYVVPNKNGFGITIEPPEEQNYALILYANGSDAVICLGSGSGAGAGLSKKDLEYPPPAIAGINVEGLYDSIKPIKYTDWLTGETKITFADGINLSLGEGFDLPSGTTVVGLCAKAHAMEVDGYVSYIK